MKWSTEQDAALKSVDQWIREGDQQVYRLFGFAGTGKTTLARHLAGGVDGDVLFCAFTGKAAHVLRQKGCHGASTIHSLIYTGRDKSRQKLKELESNLVELMAELGAEGLDAEEIDQHQRVSDIRVLIEQERLELSRPAFSLNQDSDLRDASLAVVDEVSMVDGRLGEDLLSFGTKVLVLGDPAQLPPVAGAGFFTENVQPDFMLQDIHRQAKDNPIIAMATRVRQGERLDLGNYGESRVVDGDKIGPEDALAADQVLVGRNRTRHASNRRMRSLKGFEGVLPEQGDRLVCLRNNHELGLLNGAIWKAQDMEQLDEDQILLAASSEDDYPDVEVTAWAHHFQGRGDDLPWWNAKKAEEFDYGYALTVHKSQGSQWDDVLLFDEAYCFREHRDRWLYTGITRAAEKLTVVRT